MTKSKLINSFAAFAISASVLAPTSFAFAAENTSAVSPEMTAKIEAVLKGEGYEVRKVQMEDGNFEAYVIKDGKKFEVVLNADLKITDTKAAD
jgi:Peptidase propeptide and YPEB domain